MMQGDKFLKYIFYYQLNLTYVMTQLSLNYNQKSCKIMTFQIYSGIHNPLRLSALIEN
jgi:hypothetical protein